MGKNIIIALVCASFILAGCKKSSEKNTEPSSGEQMVVTVATAKTESYPVTIVASGLIQPWQETIISAEVGGLDLTDVYVNTGDKVKKGQLLAKLNGAQVNADLLSQQANVAEAQANLEQARTEANQAVSLEKAGALSAQELLQYSTKQKTTQAQLAAAKANLELQKLKLSYTQITAPDDGVISSRSATVGSVVSNGGELFRLIRNNRLEWQAEVSLNQLNGIESGQTVMLQTADGQQIKGTVRQISPVLNANSKNGLVYVDIASTPQLKIGMSIDGYIDAGIKHGLVVPFRAIVSSDGFNYVMQLNQKNQVHKTKVELGEINGDQVAILSGLSSQAVIAVDGAAFLNESDFVSISKDKQ